MCESSSNANSTEISATVSWPKMISFKKAALTLAALVVPGKRVIDEEL